MTPERLEEIRRRLADCGPLDAGAGHDAVALIAEVDRLRAALRLWCVEVSSDRTWCRQCRTEQRYDLGLADPRRMAVREQHPHRSDCLLAAEGTP